MQATSRCRPIRRILLTLGALLVMGGPGAAHADWLTQGQVLRSIPFTLRDGQKPMLAARVAGRDGVFMLDNGTPEALLLNRDALPLSPGRFLASGFAASGQAVAIQAHPAVDVWIDGVPASASDSVRSGNFQFTAQGLGDDFLGFIGSPLLERDAWVLDYQRRRLSFIRVDAAGRLAIDPPAPADIRLTLPFFMWPGEQPTVAGTLGKLALLVDFDTGDGGTLYLTPESRRLLEQQHLLTPQGGPHWRLSGLSLGGVRWGPTTVRLVQAGSEQDRRKAGRGDQLRLGARFLAEHPSLWNFPARTLTFLRPQSAFLVALTRPQASPASH